MENFSNVEDNTLLYQVDETDTDQLDPFNNEIEIQNLKNQSQFSNQSMNNYYSTCFYTENNQMSDDFSLIFNHEDLKMGINGNTLYKKIPKFHKKIESKKKISVGKNSEKLFYVYKKHRIECRHKLRKIQRNKIRNFIEKDFLLLFEKKEYRKNRFYEFFDGNENFLNNSNFADISNFAADSDHNLEHFKIKKITNRSFRLFDKDVIIKKIMSNFLKFVKIIFEIFLSKVFDIKNLKIKDFEPGVFYTFEQCKEYLVKNKFSDFVEVSDKISKCNRKKYRFLLGSNLLVIFSEFFVNSTYFFDYLIDKIKSKYDDLYFVCFMNYTKKILS
jgi:hypothetical protein